ncbi:hypothetical protein GCM10007858_52040 [Bradyrhizobium liaoningense]|nr:hypothetical protein GCM10007858_52040 [Bradyrhizobium liaoningense]
MLAVRLTRTDNATMPSSSASASAIRVRAEPIDRAKSFIRPQATPFRGAPATCVLAVAAAIIKTPAGLPREGMEAANRPPGARGRRLEPVRRFIPSMNALREGQDRVAAVLRWC